MASSRRTTHSTEHDGAGRDGAESFTSARSLGQTSMQSAMSNQARTRFDRGLKKPVRVPMLWADAHARGHLAGVYTQSACKLAPLRLGWRACCLRWVSSQAHSLASVLMLGAGMVPASGRLCSVLCMGFACGACVWGRCGALHSQGVAPNCLVRGR